MDKWFQTIISVAGGFLSWLVGGWSLLLTVLLLLNIFDYITGVAANWGQISSKAGFRGIIKKGLIWIWVAIANLIYIVLLDQGLSIGQVIPDAVVIAFIINEIVSIAENSAKLGVNIPEPIQKALDVFNKKEGEKR